MFFENVLTKEDRLWKKISKDING